MIWPLFGAPVPAYPHRLAVGRTSLLLGCWALLFGCGARPEPPARRDGGDSLAYNMGFQIGTHNSYWAQHQGGDLEASGPGERLLDQLLIDHARSIELDLHKSELPHEFRVYHTLPGNSLCDTLPECLSLVRSFHRTLPNHQPLLVILEFKELFGSLFDDEHTIDDLDQTLRRELGALLYTPADFLAPCPSGSSLTECVQAVGWPTLAALSGRVLVAPLGYWHMLSGQDDVNWIGYAGSGAIVDRVGFPLASTLHWEGLDEETRQQVDPQQFARALRESLFFQAAGFADPDAQDFVARGGVVRVDNAFSLDEQAAAAARGLQLLQTDTPFIAYRDGGPEQPLLALPGALPTAAGREPGRRLRLLPASPPEQDVFAYLERGSGTSSRWESTLSSGIDPRNVGCLRAAASLDATGESSLTVCRQVHPNDVGPAATGLTLTVEQCDAARCSREQFQASDGSLGGPGDLLAMEVVLSSGRSCVRVQAARLVDTQLVPLWSPLGGERCVAGELKYQGLSRHGNSGASRAVYFFNTSHDGQPLVGCELSGVAVASLSGTPASSDPSLLSDTSF